MDEADCYRLVTITGDIVLQAAFHSQGRDVCVVYVPQEFVTLVRDRLPEMVPDYLNNTMLQRPHPDSLSYKLMEENGTTPRAPESGVPLFAAMGGLQDDGVPYLAKVRDCDLPQSVMDAKGAAKC